MTRVRARVALLLLAGLFAGCGKKVTSAECDAMLDRYLDLSMAPSPEIARMPPKQAESVIEERKSERRASSSYEAARGRCEREVSRAELDCAMKAPTANDWEACLD